MKTQMENTKRLNSNLRKNILLRLINILRNGFYECDTYVRDDWLFAGFEN